MCQVFTHRQRQDGSGYVGLIVNPYMHGFFLASMQARGLVTLLPFLALRPAERPANFCEKTDGDYRFTAFWPRWHFP
jgi:hypothetical protein